MNSSMGAKSLAQFDAGRKLGVLIAYDLRRQHASLAAALDAAGSVISPVQV